MPDPIDAVLAYHARSKHHLHRYAASLGYLDWATQPDPFRRYEGAPLEPLALPEAAATPTYDALFGGSIPPSPMDRAGISQLFFNAFALSAWKEYGENRWSLRVNPSSGNLHPTEAYLLAGSSLFHYAPHEHALELRRQTVGLPPDVLLVGLTSIHWREAWKYGERAFRYCQHDVGHAIAALSVSAAMLGWEVQPIDAISDDLLGRLLGVSEQTGPEAEHSDILMIVRPRGSTAVVGETELEALASGALVGTPNRLSPEHEEWPAIDTVAAATIKRSTSAGEMFGSVPSHWTDERPLSAQQIIRQRRSAVRLDGKTSMSREAFFRMLERVSPEANRVAFGAFGRPSINLALFVHRVEGLEPGLYFLLRDVERLEAFRSATKPEYAWSRVEGAPEFVPLYLLAEADAKQAARTISCQQEIASEGAFAVGMIANFELTIRDRGAWFYKRLFWEAGAVGQMLYLEAEAAGVRGTGIGCFFDDVMHELLGFPGTRFQSLYHFTVGGPVEDTRLRTAPAYGHLAR